MAAYTPTTPLPGVNVPAHPLVERRPDLAPSGGVTDRRASRRRFLAEAGTALVASLGVTAAVLAPDPNWTPEPVRVAGPDDELLAACASADVVQRRMDALYRGATRVEDDKERDALLAPLYAEQEPFLEQVVDLRAQTLAGHVARARTLLLWDKDPPSADDSYYMNERLMGALLRDLGGEDRA